MSFSRRSLFHPVHLLLLLVPLAAFLLWPSAAFAPPTKPPVTTPTITCAPNVTDGKHVIDVTVCAPNTPGATGLPAGFSVQWMTCAQNAACGWPADSDNPSGDGCDRSSFCKASFSGNAAETNSNLAAGTCLTVYAGSFVLNNPLDNPSLGYSTTCPGPLECDTCYVFRAFGHATSRLNRSAFSADCASTTDPCFDPTGLPYVGCTKSKGYFGNHGVTTGETQCALDFLGSVTVCGITFTTAAQVATYLPGGGPPVAGFPNTCQQRLALALNIALSDGQCPNYCDCVTDPDTLVTTCNPYPAGFGDAVLCGIVGGFGGTPLAGTTPFPVGSEALNGLTVQQVYDAGGFSFMTASQYAALEALLNLSFDGTGTDVDCTCGASAFGADHLKVGGCP